MSYYSLISLMPKAPVDDAQAFITAAGITDPTQQSAIITLVTNLKAYGIWTKFKAIYPIVGGTASQHKFNLKDPRDLDVAFRLTFSTGYTHSANGMLPANAFSNTFLNPTTAYSVDNNFHLSVYLRTNSAIESVDIGAQTGSSYNLLSIRRGGNISYFGINTATTFVQLAADTNCAAMYLGNRIGTTMTGFRNSTLVGTITPAVSTRPNNNIILSGYSINGLLQPSFYSNRQMAFASIGDGLTNTESANFYTAVQAFQTTLSRQV